MTRSPLVLIADDAQDVLDINRAILEDAGFRVATATDGERAVAMALELRPDVILMDLAMPVLDGWEATRRIHNDLRTCHIPILAFSCYGLRRYLDRSFEAGCVGFVEKSCRDPRQLVDVVKRAIAEHKAFGVVLHQSHDQGSGPSGSSRR